MVRPAGGSIHRLCQVEAGFNRLDTPERPTGKTGRVFGRAGVAYRRLHCHLVWATHLRRPLITPLLEPLIRGAILGKARDLGVVVHSIGGIEDHIHVVASIPPRLAVAECVKQLKGVSSHYANHQPSQPGDFGWQDGYGAISFGEKSLPDVMLYVRGQKEHHAAGSVRCRFEQIACDEDGVAIVPDR
jgi:REP element-mobilizing transposase RayT